MSQDIDLRVERMQRLIVGEEELQVPAIDAGGFRADEQGIEAPGAHQVCQFLGEGVDVGALIDQRARGANGLTGAIEQDGSESALSDIQTDKKGSRHAVQLLAERDEEPLRTPGVPNLFGVYFPPPVADSARFRRGSPRSRGLWRQTRATASRGDEKCLALSWFPVPLRCAGREGGVNRLRVRSLPCLGGGTNSPKKFPTGRDNKVKQSCPGSS